MIDEKRLLDRFCRLVEIDSPSYHEANMRDALVEMLRALEIPFSEDDAAEKIGGESGNLLAEIPGTLALAPILFCAHMDTVEPARGKRAVLHEDGRITSAGDTVLGADDCAGLAAILEAAAVLREKQLPHRPIELLFTAAEEPYCVGSGAAALSKLRSKEAYVFDLTGEVGTAANRAPTILGFTAEITGRASHAGFAPEQGVHAVRAAAEVIAALPMGRFPDGETTLNVGSIEGGAAANIVPERCVFRGEIRSFSDEAAEAALELIRGLLENTAVRYGAKYTLHHEKHVKAYCTQPDSPAIERFRSACAALSLPFSLTQTFGGSDMNQLAQHGISGVVVATAMMRCHAADEYTTAGALADAARLALTLMLSKE